MIPSPVHQWDFLFVARNRSWSVQPERHQLAVAEIKIAQQQEASAAQHATFALDRKGNDFTSIPQLSLKMDEELIPARKELMEVVMLTRENKCRIHVSSRESYNQTWGPTRLYLVSPQILNTPNTWSPQIYRTLESHFLVYSWGRGACMMLCVDCWFLWAGFIQNILVFLQMFVSLKSWKLPNRTSTSGCQTTTVMEKSGKCPTRRETAKRWGIPQILSCNMPSGQHFAIR